MSSLFTKSPRVFGVSLRSCPLLYNGTSTHTHTHTHRMYVNPLISTVKPHSNGLLYSNMVIGTVAVNGWAVTFGTTRTGLSELGLRPCPFSLYHT